MQPKLCIFVSLTKELSRMSRNPKNRLREPIPIPEAAPLPEPEVIDVERIFQEYVSGAIDLVVVLGPTASGKTRYAVNLARQLNALAAQVKRATELIRLCKKKLKKAEDDVAKVLKEE